MQVTVEAGEGLERRIKVQLPADRVDSEIDKKLKHIARTARIHGFRPGKVPLNVVRKRFGGQVRDEVLGELIRSSFMEAVTQEKLRPAGEPSIRDVAAESGVDLGYTAVFEVMPEFELAPLSEMTLKRPVVEIADTDVAAMIEKLRKQRASWEPVERPAQLGDRVTITYQGTVDGEPFEGGEGKDVVVELGAGRLIDGFEEGLVGVTAGEHRELSLQFPSDYRVESLKGKPVTFSVDTSAVSEPVLPEVDVEFAAALGVEQGGVESLTKEIRENMQRELDQKILGVVKNRVMDRILAANPIEVPKVMVEGEVDRLREQARGELASAGRGGNLELPRELFAEQAQRRVALGLLIAKVVRDNGIRVDSQRVRSTIEKFAASYEEPEEVVRWYYADRERIAGVETVVLEDQVVDWIADNAVVEDEVMSFDTFMAGVR